MPDTITNELIYEVLKTIQGGVSLLREDMASVKTRLTSLDSRVALIHGDLAELSGRMDRLEVRQARVETRLNLGDVEQ